MAYIGNQPPDIGAYGVQSFDGGGTSFPLSKPSTTATVLLFIDGVRQTPVDAYSVSGTTLTTTGTTPSGTDNVTVQFLGDVVDFGEPSDDSVSATKIQDDAVTTDKILDDAVTADKLANSINTEIAANTAKVTNATHTGDVTGATALTIAADAVTPAKMADSAYLANRNMIINGAMQVSQRGTSEASLAFTSYGYFKAPDRFRTSIEVGTWTVSQSSEAPEGFANSYKFDCTTLDASPTAAYSNKLAIRAEAQDLQNLKYGTANAETVTLSFWVRSAKTGIYIVELRHGETSISNSIAYTISVADTWEKKELSFSGYVTTAINNDNGVGLYIYFWLVAGSDYTSGTLAPNTWQSTAANKAVGQVNLADSTSNDWHITGVQFEIGGTATPFEHKTFGQELAACQRYYEKVTTGSTGGGYSSTHFVTMFQWMTPKRVAPTLTQGGVLSITKFGVLDYTQSSMSMSINGAGRNDTMGAQLHFGNFSSLTGDTPHGINIDTTFYIKCDAEL